MVSSADGVYSGIGFGCAPVEAQSWWDKMAGACGGATKANTSFCGGPGCTKDNPCTSAACKQPGSHFTCTRCSDNLTDCATNPTPWVGPALPPVHYEWWQLPTKVEVNGAACASCIANRSVTLESAQLKAAGPHVSVHITFGQSDGLASSIPETGASAHQRWLDSQAERSSVSLDAVQAGCTPPADIQAALANSSAFSAAMEKAGLGDRFEAAQAAAFREALNASVTRCAGRASGEIGPIPAEPESWKKYKMAYNQTAADAYFIGALTPLRLRACLKALACAHWRPFACPAFICTLVPGV